MATITVKAAGGGDYTTLQAGCDAATAGDTIEVYNGTYNENVDIDTNSGGAGTEITLKAAAGQTPAMNLASGTFFFRPVKNYWILDFDNWTFGPTANIAGLIDTAYSGGPQPDHVTVKNVYATDINLLRLYLNSAGGAGITNWTFQDCYFNTGGNGHVITLGNNSNHSGLLVQRCFFSGMPATRAGIVIQDKSDATAYAINIRNCIFDGGIAGIQDSNDAQNGLTLNIYNNTFYNNTDGIYLPSVTRTTNYVIKNNIFQDAANYGIDDPNTTATYDIDYNCFYSNTTGDIRNASKGANDQDGDPGMTAPATDDFTLTGLGLAVDNGLDLSGTFTDDYAGTTRTVPWDIGAYNYSAAVTRRIFIIS
jgi:hypothetical protein